MKYFIPLLFTFILAACAPSERAIQTALAETQAAMPTATLTPIPPTDTPSPTNTPTTTQTSVPTETSTPLPTETLEATATPLPPLKDVLVTGEELNALADIWNTFGLEQQLSNCPGLDCAGKLWSSDAGDSLIIHLIKADSDEQAGQFLATFAKNQVEDGYQDVPTPEMLPFPGETWIGVLDNKTYEMMAIYGPYTVALFLSSKTDLDDGEILIAAYAKMQIEKLISNGY